MANDALSGDGHLLLGRDATEAALKSQPVADFRIIPYGPLFQTEDCVRVAGPRGRNIAALSVRTGSAETEIFAGSMSGTGFNVAVAPRISHLRNSA